MKQIQLWSRVEERILRQKARIKWLKAGDENTIFFHSSIKSRIASNSIASLTDKNGVVHEAPDAIEGEVLGFYHALLGSSTSILARVDVQLVGKGKTLSAQQAQLLVKTIKYQEIQTTLFGIDDDKAPSYDV